MNYFGHAAVASWTSGEPGVLLGAMLPDFATMCRGRLAAQTDAVARGVDIHHATDSAFHVLPSVTGMMRELDERLAGVSRGARRAVAHIGVELLLDGVLLDHAAYRDAYLAGVDANDDVAWVDGGERFALLRERLRVYGLPEDLRGADGITARLARILAPRPLLAPTPEDLRAIHRALADFRPRVVVAADTVMRALRRLSSPSS